MVEFTGTTPSEAGGNGQGSITSFASRLDAATLAAVGDPTVERGGIESLAPGSGPSSSDYKSAPNAFAKALMNKFPGLFTVNQGETLFDIYSKNDTYDTGTIIQRMKDDEFLLDTTTGWLVMSEYIDGNLIAEALFRNAGLPSDGTMTAEQFLPATQKLFGDYTKDYNGFVLTPQISKFLAQVCGTDGKIEKQNMASMFNSGTNSIIEVKMGLVSKDYFGLFVRPTNVSTDFDQVVPFATLVAFMMTNDADNNGWLSTAELKIAVNGTDRGQSSANDAAVQTYMNCYGKKDSSGNWEINIDGLTLMLSDRSLNQPTELTGSDFSSWGDPFLVDLNLIPITRVIWGASYGDQQSLNDGILSQGELIKLFGGLGQTVSPAQAKLLVDVYGDGTFVTQANVQQMRNDGFFSLATEVSKTCTLNWDSIPATTLARAIFKQVGIDPDAAGAAVTADQFSAGFKLLYGDSKTLDDPTGLTKNLGTENTLSVVQMGLILEGLNTVFSIPLDTTSVADGRGLIGTPAFHNTGWWDSILKFAGDEAKNVVSTIATIAGVTEDVVAGVLNGKIPADVAMVKGGYKIITAISDAIKKGDESAKNLMTTMGTALKSLVSTVADEVKVLSDEGKALVDQLVAAAKEGATEIEIRALSVLSGMSAEAARVEIETMAFKSRLTNFAKDMSYDNMKTLIPNYDDTLADLTKAYDSAVASFGNSDADRMLLAEKGYKFDSDNNLIKEGRVLGNIEKLDVFGDYCRADIGVELGVAATGIGYPGFVKDLDAFEARVIYSYKGKDANGNAKHELRFRIGDLAGVALPTIPVAESAGVKGDAGFFTNHDILLSWAVSPNGSSTMNDVIYNSAIGMVLEGSGPAGLADYIPGPVGAALNEVGLPIPMPGSVWGTWKSSADVEAGVGWSATVSYNLSKMGNLALVPFISEIAGAAIGTAASSAALTDVEIETVGGATSFLALFGVTIVHASAMLGAFSADLVYTLADYVAGTGNANLSFGLFSFVSPRLGVENAWIEGDNGFSIAARLRGQISAGSSGNNLY
jgi:hypothetical protein